MSPPCLFYKPLTLFTMSSTFSPVVQSLTCLSHILIVFQWCYCSLIISFSPLWLLSGCFIELNCFCLSLSFPFLTLLYWAGKWCWITIPIRHLLPYTGTKGGSNCINERASVPSLEEDCNRDLACWSLLHGWRISSAVSPEGRRRRKATISS